MKEPAKTGIDDIAEDVKEILEALQLHAERSDVPIIVCAVMGAAARLLKELRSRINLGALAPLPAAAGVPAAAEKPADKGHRHKYGPDGRCALSAPGGSGMCSAVSREAKKAASGQAALPATSVGTSS